MQTQEAYREAGDNTGEAIWDTYLGMKDSSLPLQTE